MRKAISTALALAVVAFATPVIASDVVVNGVRLNRAQIAWLASYSCGPVIPGNYWLNTVTGYWGYAGSRQVMGHIRDRCGQRRVFKDGNMSREGRLFRPGELLR